MVEHIHLRRSLIRDERGGALPLAIVLGALLAIMTAGIINSSHAHRFIAAGGQRESYARIAARSALSELMGCLGSARPKIAGTSPCPGGEWSSWSSAAGGSLLTSRESVVGPYEFIVSAEFAAGDRVIITVGRAR